MVLNLRKNILILNDLSIPCRLIRSDRRSLGLEIRRIPEDGAELLIRAPRRMKIAYIEWFINEKERWITEKYLAALVEKPRPKTMEIPDYVTEQWLRTEGAERFQQKTAFWAARMKVTYGRITIRDQKTRWGSCSAARSVNLSHRLIAADPKLIDYVIIHELCHTVHMDHSPDFYRLVESFLPDYREREKGLKEVSRLLTEYGL